MTDFPIVVVIKTSSLDLVDFPLTLAFSLVYMNVSEDRFALAIKVTMVEILVKCLLLLYSCV